MNGSLYMKNYGGNKIPLIVIQKFFLIFIEFVSTFICLSIASISIFERQKQTSPIPLGKVHQYKMNWEK